MKIIVQCRFFESCALGVYDDYLDIDNILLTNCNGQESEKYTDIFLDIVTDSAMKYFAVVNTFRVPYREYEDKKFWYDFFASIEKVGHIIYK